jgi:hypothetical protein
MCGAFFHKQTTPLRTVSERDSYGVTCEGCYRILRTGYAGVPWLLCAFYQGSKKAAH